MKTWLRRAAADHPLLAFVVLAFGLTWIGSLVYLLAKPPDPTLPRLLATPAALLWYYAPCAAALLVVGTRQGRPGAGRLLRRLVLWPAGLGWLAFVLLYPFLLHLAAAGLAWLLGGPAPTFFATRWGDEAIPGGSLLVTLLVLVLVQVFLRGIGEETGWRGLALPLLQSGRSSLAAGLLVGLIWALWHFHPANLILLTWPAHLFLLLNITGSSVLYTWLMNRTGGSLLAAILFHTLLNVAEWVVPLGLLEGELLRPLLQTGLVWLTVAALVALAGRDLGRAET